MSPTGIPISSFNQQAQHTTWQIIEWSPVMDIDTCENPRNARRRRAASPLAGLTMVGFMLFVASMLIVLSTPACSSSGGEAGTMRVETLENGVTRITHESLPDRYLQVDTLAVWDLWGDDAGYMFNNIAGAAGSDDGFYLCDRGNLQVVYVDLNGTYQFHFGRSGEGPGEFRFPHAIATGPGEVWVADLMNNRFSIFGRDGSYLKDARWGAFAWSGNSFQPLSTDRLLLNTQTRSDFENPGSVDPRYYMLVRDLHSGRSDTLTSMSGMKEQQIEVRSSTGQGMVFVGPPQFAPRLHWAYSSETGRLLAVTGQEYRIEEWGLDGHLLTEFLAPTPDLTVTQRVRDWFFDERGFRFGFGTGETFQATRESLENYPFADRRQAIESIGVDPTGRIWVLVNLEEPGATRLDLYSPDWRYLGSAGGLSMPLTFTTEGLALIRSTDEDDIDTYHVISVQQQ